MHRGLAVLAALSLLACRRTPAPPVPPAPAAAATPPRDAEVRRLSGAEGQGIAAIAIGAREMAIVADAEERGLVLVDLASSAVVGRVPLAGAPGQVVVGEEGTIFAAVRGAGEVVALRLRPDLSARVVARRETSDEPYGLALAKGTLHVTTIAEPALVSLRASDLSPVRTTPLGKDPRSVVALPDGRLAVSHATGSRLSFVGEAGAAEIVSLATRERRRDFGQMIVTKPRFHTKFDVDVDEPAPRTFVTMKRSATQGFGLAVVGDDVLVPEALVLTSDGAPVSTGYGAVESSTLSTHVPYVARVDAKAKTARNAEMSGPTDRICFEGTPSCIVPRAAAGDGKNVYIACTDSDAIAVHDPTVELEHAPDCRKARAYQRKVPFEAPTAVNVAHLSGGDAIVAWSELTRRVGIASVADPAAPVRVAEIPAKEPLPEAVVRGRALFHRSGDDRIAANGRACASCHVEGREDGLVWPTPKGKRQTPMLAGRLVGTEPYEWNGSHATLPVHIKSTLVNLGGKGLPDDDLEALAAYVRSLPGPAKRARSADPAVARGQAIFRSDEAACSSCHDEASRYTDGSVHALRHASEEKFDTPSLAFVGQTAPYFHDGRFATLEDLVDGCEGLMGSTKQLSPDDRRALVSFLKSL